jgi:hypothetical protein
MVDMARTLLDDRRRRQRLVVPTLFVAVVLGGASVALWLVRPASRASSTPAQSADPASRVPGTTAAIVDPGALPQTANQPTATDAAEQDRARQLFSAIVADNPDEALSTFFPRAAYLQVKSLTNAGADYDNRLIAQFRNDIHALHVRLVSQARSTPVFERLDVGAEPVWITPGVESNKGSYWRVYDSQMGYSDGGVARSIPIKSMISWRGQWYVVHLIAIK